MKYSTIENLGISPSKLGFGCMRLPTKDGAIDEAEAQRMIDKAMESGVTYYDTAWPYHGGESERFLGKALKKYDRSKYYLATKLPIWEVHNLDDAKRIFATQLEKLQTGYFDFYLMHSLRKSTWEDLLKMDILPYFEQLKAEGKIKYLGFSFHDNFDVFKEIITYKKWDFCQIQYNYMDANTQAGTDGYKLAEEMGVPLIIMEPIKGGTLANLPDDIANMFKASDSKASIASWALKWVASQPNNKVILSGMTTYDQLLDNLDTFDNFEPLSAENMKLVEDAADAIRARVKNGCTGCRYCMPCPFGVDIPAMFSMWNQHAMYGNDGSAKWQYFNRTPVEKRADQCKECGACEKACPQKLSIRADLKRVVSDFNAL